MPLFEPFYVPDTELGTWHISFKFIEIFCHRHSLPKKIEVYVHRRGNCPLIDCVQRGP